MCSIDRERMIYLLEAFADSSKLQKDLLAYFDECGSLSSKDDSGWALLSKLVLTCKPEALKAISSRVQKKLIASAKRPITVCILHFIRSFLLRFPWLITCNERTLASICSHAVDFAVENRSNLDICRLTSDIYALWARNRFDDILTNALANTLNGLIVDKKDGSTAALHFDTANQRYVAQFVATVFSVHAVVLERCNAGDEIAANEWLDAASKSLAVDDIDVDKCIFKWLKIFLSRTKTIAHLVSRRICSLFTDYYRPSEAYYEALKEYLLLGPNSDISTLFRILVQTASKQIHSQEYGMAYAEALNTMLLCRQYLLGVQDVIQLQRIVCQEAFKNRDCRPAFSLLFSLLSMNHELVPSPIQVAQSIFSSSKISLSEINLGRALCSIISRPRIQMIVPQENLLKKLNDIVISGQQMHFESSGNLQKILREETAETSHSCGGENEVNSSEIMHCTVNSVLKAKKDDCKVRKREHVISEETTVKRKRIDARTCQQLNARRNEVSDLLIVIDEKQIVRKEERRNDSDSMKQEENVAVDKTSGNEVESRSDIPVIVIDEDSGGCELTVQQMMADFVIT